MKNLKKIAVFALLASVIVVSSSCNRGVGCPTNFKTEQAAKR
jgi:hypothetical protein